MPFVHRGNRLRVGEWCRLLSWDCQRGLTPILEQHQLGLDLEPVPGPHAPDPGADIVPAVHKLRLMHRRCWVRVGERRCLLSWNCQRSLAPLFQQLQLGLDVEPMSRPHQRTVVPGIVPAVH
jgi:hypothetical protein